MEQNDFLNDRIVKIREMLNMKNDEVVSVNNLAKLYGTTVYYDLDFFGEANPNKIEEITICDDDIILVTGSYTLDPLEFKETFFTDKREAERKLKSYQEMYS